MTHDAIVGARYMDTVFNSEFVIVAVEADRDDGLPDPEDISVMLEYEDHDYDRIVTVDLDTFRDLDDIYVVDVPEHAQ